MEPENKDPKQEIALLLARIVQDNEVISREVTVDDLDHVISEGAVLHKLCNIPFGPFSGAVCLSHSQIENKAPLRFFVGKNGTLVMNPKITRHTSAGKLMQEGCYRFPDSPTRHANRFYRIEWEFDLVGIDDEGKKTLLHQKGEDKAGNAQAVQHMIDHMDARLCSEALAEV